jgi:hypothetical protein
MATFALILVSNECTTPSAVVSVVLFVLVSILHVGFA